jgi:hypothetical protein
MLKRGLIGAGGTVKRPESTYLGYCGDNAASGGAITVLSADLGEDAANRLIVVAVAGSFGDTPNSVTVGGVSATRVAGPGNTITNFGQVWAVSVSGGTGDIVATIPNGPILGFHWYAVYTDTPTPSATVNDNSSRTSTNIAVYSGGITIGAISLRSDSTMDDVSMTAAGAVTTYGPIVSGGSTRFGFTWIALPTETASPATFNFSGISEGGNKAIASWEP